MGYQITNMPTHSTTRHQRRNESDSLRMVSIVHAALQTNDQANEQQIPLPLRLAKKKRLELCGWRKTRLEDMGRKVTASRSTKLRWAYDNSSEFFRFPLVHDGLESR